VNAFLAAATVLLLGLLPCGFVAARSRPIDGLVALELGGTVTTLVLLLLAEGFHRSIYFSAALTLAVLSFVGGLAFARFLERLR
jgi:multicomponent Na+:H+ antiporter subunit F